MLSICVVHCARSVLVYRQHRLALFPDCVRSLNEAVRKSGVRAELVIADWPKVEQEAPLKEWLPSACEIPVRIIEMDGDFSKGRGCNAAARAAQGDVLFFLDADMLVPAEVLTQGMEYASKGLAWFPGYVAQQGPGSDVYTPPKGPGTGNAFMTPAQFDECGGWPEQKHWGGFDRPISKWFEARGLSAEVVTKRRIVPGFIHQWHPKFHGWPKGRAWAKEA